MEEKVYYKEIYVQCKNKCEQYKQLLELDVIENRLIG